MIKALAVGSAADVSALKEYSQVADMILVDARPSEDTERPGGNGVSFDWRLLHGRRWRRPWFLAGGLAPENVEEAIRATGAQQVDVSSGVELVPGYKDPEQIERFVRAAKGVAAAA